MSGLLNLDYQQYLSYQCLQPFVKSGQFTKSSSAHLHASQACFFLNFTIYTTSQTNVPKNLFSFLFLVSVQFCHY